MLIICRASLICGKLPTYKLIELNRYLILLIYMLIICRASLICGKLPAEEIRDIRSKLTKQMDVLNHLLHLDLVVR